MYNKTLGYDRRRFQRLSLNVEVICSIKEPMVARIAIGDMDIHAQMIDLSQVGLAIAAKYNIPVGAVLTISFDLAKMNEKGTASFYQTIKVAGDVRSNIKLSKDEYRLGICFLKIGETDKAMITQFVDMVMNR